jgi:hypothetical protein
MISSGCDTFRTPPTLRGCLQLVFGYLELELKNEGQGIMKP